MFDAKGRLVYRGRIDNLYAGFGKKRFKPTKRDLRDTLDACSPASAWPSGLPRRWAATSIFPMTKTKQVNCCSLDGRWQEWPATEYIRGCGSPANQRMLPRSF